MNHTALTQRALHVFGAAVGALLLLVARPVAAYSNGQAATNVLGQLNFTLSGSATSQSGLNNPGDVWFDSASNKAFVVDTSNNRVLVFDVASITDGENAVNVLGQANFNAGSYATTATGMDGPQSVVASNNRVFVADRFNHRVLAFDKAGIADGVAATHVLGQASFTVKVQATTQSGLKNPYGLAFDQANNRLFVSDGSNNRVLVFDVSAIANGQNAVNVLGQTDFVTSTGGTSQGKFSNPKGLAFDAANNRLFVADNGNNRVLVFDVASVTDGENAVNVLGQADFVSSGSATAQAALGGVDDVAFDPSGNRLFVLEVNNNRTVIFDVASIADGESAVNVLGQADFTSNTGGTTATKLNGPRGLAFDSSGSRLYIADEGNHRVIVFAETTASAGGGSMCPMPSVLLARPNGGESFVVGAEENVFWGSSGCGVVGIKLSWSTDGGVTFPTEIISLSLASTGYFRWTVPSLPTGTGRMRAQLMGHGGVVLATDSSDGNVSILAPASSVEGGDAGSSGEGTSDVAPAGRVTLRYPNGGETFRAGGEVTALWIAEASSGIDGSVAAQLQYSVDGGATYVPLTEKMANTGARAFKAPPGATATGKMRIVIYFPDKSSVADESDASFTVIADDATFDALKPFVDGSSPTLAGIYSPTSYTDAEKGVPAADPNAAGGYAAVAAVAATPTIDVDKAILPPPSSKRVPCVGGGLVKSPKDKAVYYCGKNGKRFVFPNQKVFLSWYPNFSDVRTVSAEELATVPIGGNITYKPGVKMVKIKTDPRTYAVARGGLLRWVKSENSAKRLYGDDWNRNVEDVSDAFFANYTIGESIE